MHSVDEMRKQIVVLAETARTLASELDASRRAMVAIGRERDALRRELDRLRDECASSAAALRESWQHDLEPVPESFRSERRRPPEPERLLDLCGWGASEGRAGSLWEDDPAAQLTAALRKVEEERDAALLERDQAFSAMLEIRGRLESTLQDPDDGPGYFD